GRTRLWIRRWMHPFKSQRQRARAILATQKNDRLKANPYGKTAIARAEGKVTRIKEKRDTRASQWSIAHARKKTSILLKPFWVARVAFLTRRHRRLSKLAEAMTGYARNVKKRYDLKTKIAMRRNTTRRDKAFHYLETFKEKIRLDLLGKTRTVIANMGTTTKQKKRITQNTRAGTQLLLTFNQTASLIEYETILLAMEHAIQKDDLTLAEGLSTLLLDIQD
ncbi:MAG: hypothetical protein U1C71_04710, partial [archaeon]|nr:hypothetical protein [archaeon]